jgi:hypothetical protein
MLYALDPSVQGGRTLVSACGTYSEVAFSRTLPVTLYRPFTLYMKVAW